MNIYAPSIRVQTEDANTDRMERKTSSITAAGECNVFNNKQKSQTEDQQINRGIYHYKPIRPKVVFCFLCFAEI